MDCVVPNNIPLQLLEEITDSFSEHRLIGFGSCGKVYMGVHKDGKKIAVKLFYGMPGLNDEQFQNEFNYLKQFDHQNIVRLVGCCDETKGKLINHMGKLVLAEKRYTALCLEYMNNGSLDNYISDEYNGHSWSTRYKIIKGVCEGIKYLHEEMNPPIYHLDLKPANVLLDENMLPKISDFGLSKLFGEEQTQIIGNDRGTDAYSPPEYKKGGIVSMKFDIFSLGVIIIKIMSGRTGYCKRLDMSSEQFIELVHGNWSNRLQKRLECGMGMEIYSAQIKTCIEIAVRCVEYERNRRPNIGDIVNKLNETETNVLLEKSIADFVLPSPLRIAKHECPPQVFARKNKEYTSPVLSKRLMEPSKYLGTLWKMRIELALIMARILQSVHTTGSLVLETDVSLVGEALIDTKNTIEDFKTVMFSFQHVHRNGRDKLNETETNVLLEKSIADFVLLNPLWIAKHTYSLPEYKKGGIVSREIDIYNKGVILLEMARRMGYCKSLDMSSEQFIELVHRNGRDRPIPAEDRRRRSGKMRHTNSSSASRYTVMRNWKY